MPFSFGVVAYELLSGEHSLRGEDSTLCLWPMPDLAKPPLHTLPRRS